MLPAMSRTQADLQKEIERLSQNIEEGERAIVRNLDELGRMSDPATEACNKKPCVSGLTCWALHR